MHMQMLEPGFAHVEAKVQSENIGKSSTSNSISQSQSRNPINQKANPISHRSQLRIASYFLIYYFPLDLHSLLAALPRDQPSHRTRFECELFYKLNSFFPIRRKIRLADDGSGDGSSCLLASMPFATFPFCWRWFDF